MRELGQGKTLTSEQDPAKEAMVPVQGVAVPAMLAELVLALCCPLSHSQANGTHHVWMSVAQLPLAAHQAWHIVTHHPRGATSSTHVPVMSQYISKSNVNTQGGSLFPRTAKFKELFKYECLMHLMIGNQGLFNSVKKQKREA